MAFIAMLGTVLATYFAYKYGKEKEKNGHNNTLPKV